MRIIRYDPFEEFEAIQEFMNRSFEEILLGVPQNLVPTSRWIPAVDIYETDNHLFFHAELPGVEPDDIEIHVYGGRLILKGTRSFPEEGKHENYHRIERSYGTFERYFTLPDTINIQNITATFKDGVLTLTLPKHAEPTPHKIKISVE